MCPQSRASIADNPWKAFARPIRLSTPRLPQCAIRDGRPRTHLFGKCRLEPRGQIQQPLRRMADHPGFDGLVVAEQDQYADGQEQAAEHAGRSLRAGSSGGRAASDSLYGETGSALRSTSLKNSSTVGRAHALAKAVHAVPASFLGLIGAFRHALSSRKPLGALSFASLSGRV